MPLIKLSMCHPCPCCTGEFDMSARQIFQHDDSVHSDTKRWKMNFLSPVSAAQLKTGSQKGRWQDQTCTPRQKLEEGLD